MHHLNCRKLVWCGPGTDVLDLHSIMVQLFLNLRDTHSYGDSWSLDLLCWTHADHSSPYSLIVLHTCLAPRTCTLDWLRAGMDDVVRTDNGTPLLNSLCVHSVCSAPLLTSTALHCNTVGSLSYVLSKFNRASSFPSRTSNAALDLKARALLASLSIDSSRSSCNAIYCLTLILLLDVSFLSWLAVHLGFEQLPDILIWHFSFSWTHVVHKLLNLFQAFLIERRRCRACKTCFSVWFCFVTWGLPFSKSLVLTLSLSSLGGWRECFVWYLASFQTTAAIPECCSLELNFFILELKRCSWVAAHRGYQRLLSL